MLVCVSLLLQMTAINHWFLTVAFAALGGLALVNPSCFTRIQPYFKQMRARGWAYDRIIAVAVRREQLENVPRAYGYVLGILCLALAAAGALTNVTASLWYALFCLVAAAIFSTVFTHLRNVQPRRVATLTARAPEQIIPRAWVAAALAVAVLPLIDLAIPQLRWTAVAVTASAIVIVATGWRATEMPAVLEGHDLPVERFVDARLRVIRARNVMSLAAAASFVYFSQTQVAVHGSILRIAAMLASVCVFEAFTIVSLRNMFGSPTAEELERWQLQQSA
jgi:hypothetical protein